MTLTMTLILMMRRVMMNNSDALEVIDDIQELINCAPFDVKANDFIELLQWKLDQKRAEFAEPQGDCCG